MGKIEYIENIKNGEGYLNRFKFTIPIPELLSMVDNKEEILNSWKMKYPTIDSLDGEGNIIFIDSYKSPYEQSLEDLKDAINAMYANFETILSQIPIVAGDALIGQSWTPETI